MKKILALLLAVVMLLTLCSCGKKKNAGDLSSVDVEGTWTMSLNLNALLSSGSVQNMSAIFRLMNIQELGLKMTTNVTFKDGVMTVDPAGLVNFYRDLFDAMEAWVSASENAAAFDSFCQENGLVKEDLLAQITGDLPDNLANELVHEMGDLCYEVEGDKLYTWSADGAKDSNGFYQFTYKDNVITVTMVAEDGQTVPLSAGDFVFTKK